MDLIRLLFLQHFMIFAIFLEGIVAYPDRVECPKGIQYLTWKGPLPNRALETHSFLLPALLLALDMRHMVCGHNIAMAMAAFCYGLQIVQDTDVYRIIVLYLKFNNCCIMWYEITVTSHDFHAITNCQTVNCLLMLMANLGNTGEGGCNIKWIHGDGSITR